MPHTFPRVITIVLDSVGCGELPDAHLYGDEGSDTLGNIAKQVPLRVPALRSLGLSRVAMTGFTDNGVNVVGTAINNAGLPNGASAAVAYNPISDRTRWNFAWALMAGLSYDVTPNLKLDLGYRYLNMGRGTTGTINCLCGVSFPGFTIAGMASHDLKIGMRWMLNDRPAPVMAAAAPMPAPMPAPLVRKY